jgi:sRNA-binding protein
MKRNTLRELLQQAGEAKRAYVMEVFRRLRSGETMYIKHGKNKWPVRIVGIWGDGRVRVKGKSGNAYVVNAARLLERDER